MSRTLPLAHRTLVFYRALKKLDGLNLVAYSIPGLKQQGWQFGDDRGIPTASRPKSTAFQYMHEAYTASKQDLHGKVTVPTAVDRRPSASSTNESSEIIRMLNTEFNAITGDAPTSIRSAARRDRRGERARLSQRQQCVYRAGLRQVAGGLRGGL